MQLKFGANQEFQVEAVEAVVSLFEGHLPSHALRGQRRRGEAAFEVNRGEDLRQRQGREKGETGALG